MTKKALKKQLKKQLKKAAKQAAKNKKAIKIEKGLKEAIELGKNIRKQDRGCRDSRHLIFYLDFKLFLYCFGETPISRLNIV